MKNFIFSVILAMGLAGTACWADSSVLLQTTSLGDGRFEYRLHLQYNGFFDVFDSVSMDFPFEGFQEFESTDGANEVDAGDSHVRVKWLGAQPRVVDWVVTVRSESSLVGHADVYVCFLAVPSGWSCGGGIISENIAGYIRFQGLAPVSPGDPGLAGASTSSNVVMVPDPQLTAFTTNSLTWNWSSGATMRIEASPDLAGWSPVTQMVNTSTMNTWISSVPLTTYGNAFRVNLVSNKFSPFSSVLGHAVRRSVSTQAVLPSGIEPQMDGQLGICFPSQSGHAYQVRVWDAEGRLLARKDVAADGSQSTAKVLDQGPPGIRWITIDSPVP